MKRTAVCVALLVLGLSLPAAGLSLVFEQASFLDDSGGYASRYSDWGRVEISLSSADHSLFYPMTIGPFSGYGGMVNIVSDAAGAPSWEVANLPIFYLGPSELDGRLPQGAWFDLGVAPGTQVTSLNYLYSVDPLPRASMPTGSLTAAPVTETTLNLISGTSYWLMSQYVGGAGTSTPGSGSDWNGVGPGEHVAGISHVTVPDANVPQVSEPTNHCAPGSAARSIQYMDDTHPSVSNPNDVQTTEQMLAEDMNTTANGTNLTNILSGKTQFTSDSNMPIMSGVTNSFATAMSTLGKGGDVEAAVNYGSIGGKPLGSHMTFVSEIQEIQDSSGQVTGYVVKTVDDPKQGDGNAGSKCTTYRFDVNGNLMGFWGLGSGKLIQFLCEEVKAGMDDMDFRIGPNGYYVVAPGGGTDPIPTGSSSHSHCSDSRIYHGGLWDMDHPGNPVFSTLLVNPSGEPGDQDKLHINLNDVIFVPPDPTASTVMGFSLGLSHQLPESPLYGTLLPMVESSQEVFLKSILATSSFFDITYQVDMAGQVPQYFHVFGEIAESLRGKVWVLGQLGNDPLPLTQSFFDISLQLEFTPDSYSLLGLGTTLMNIVMEAWNTPRLGDMNNDGTVNNQDIEMFVLALTDLPAYQLAYPGIDILAVGDINGDLAFNNQDIAPFVTLLTGGPLHSAGLTDSSGAVPEPASLALLCLGTLMMLRHRRRNR